MSSTLLTTSIAKTDVSADNISEYIKIYSEASELELEELKRVLLLTIELNRLDLKERNSAISSYQQFIMWHKSLDKIYQVCDQY